MTTQANNNNKINPFKISEQVKTILQGYGLSKVFNYADYSYFKSQCKKAFNRPQAIAEKFIEEYQDQTDFNTYIF